MVSCVFFQGQQGRPGSDGIQGPAGRQGDPGEQGPAGPQGGRGLPVRRGWKEEGEGRRGREEGRKGGGREKSDGMSKCKSWQNSHLKAKQQHTHYTPQGDPGPQGPSGANGPPGERGTDGNPGQAGPPGTSGRDVRIHQPTTVLYCDVT